MIGDVLLYVGAIIIALMPDPIFMFKEYATPVPKKCRPTIRWPAKSCIPSYTPGLVEKRISTGSPFIQTEAV